MRFNWNPFPGKRKKKSCQVYFSGQSVSHSGNKVWEVSTAGEAQPEYLQLSESRAGLESCQRSMLSGSRTKGKQGWYRQHYFQGKSIANISLSDDNKWCCCKLIAGKLFGKEAPPPDAKASLELEQFHQSQLNPHKLHTGCSCSSSVHPGQNQGCCKGVMCHCSAIQRQSRSSMPLSVLPLDLLVSLCIGGCRMCPPAPPCLLLIPRSSYTGRQTLADSSIVSFTPGEPGTRQF